MIYIKIFYFDFKNVLLKNKPLLLCPIIISVLSCLDFKAKLSEVNLQMATYSDLWFYLFGGMKKYVPSMENAFMLPIVWITVVIILPFILLNYPLQNIQSNGQQLLVRSKSRMVWWLSKCLSIIACTMYYYFTIIISLLILCLIFDFSIINHLNIDLLKQLFLIGNETEIIYRESISLGIWLLPLFMLISINLIQMTLILFIKPIFSFLFIIILFMSSAYLLEPFLLGNYLMIFRYNWIIKDGVSSTIGYLLSIILMIVSITIGLIKFRYYDILNKE